MGFSWILIGPFVSKYRNLTRNPTSNLAENRTRNLYNGVYSLTTNMIEFHVRGSKFFPIFVAQAEEFH